MYRLGRHATVRAAKMYGALNRYPQISGLDTGKAPTGTIATLCGSRATSAYVTTCDRQNSKEKFHLPTRSSTSSTYENMQHRQAKRINTCFVPTSTTNAISASCACMYVGLYHARARGTAHRPPKAPGKAAQHSITAGQHCAQRVILDVAMLSVDAHRRQVHTNDRRRSLLSSPIKGT